MPVYSVSYVPVCSKAKSEFQIATSISEDKKVSFGGNHCVLRSEDRPVISWAKHVPDAFEQSIKNPRTEAVSDGSVEQGG